jgi:hypothetical protein
LYFAERPYSEPAGKKNVCTESDNALVEDTIGLKDPMQLPAASADGFMGEHARHTPDLTERLYDDQRQRKVLTTGN